jgi:glutathione peroxidase
MSESIYDFEAARLTGGNANLGDYRGQVLLVVNTASRCGFTPQYAGLESLYQRYRDQGLVVLGFPCNQFGGQEPGSAEEIGAFCQTSYSISFPMFAKIDVNGPDTHPLYAFLKHQAAGILGTEAIKWNFTKFLVGRDGRTVRRYASATTPEELAADIQKALSEGSVP